MLYLAIIGAKVVASDATQFAKDRACEIFCPPSGSLK
jgi:hypothetical protein